MIKMKQEKIDQKNLNTHSELSEICEYKGEGNNERRNNKTKKITLP